ncbi:MAG: hypothetical protein ACKOET_05775, partial [Verrucomicrobiota bacterium]
MRLTLIAPLLLCWSLTRSLPAAPPPEPRFRAVNIDTNLAIGYGLALADVDGDRRVDVVLCDKNQVAWYQ